MGEAQLELPDVEYVCAQFAGSRVAKLPCVLSIALHRFRAVERRRRHAPAGLAVDQEAGAAEAFEILERWQHGRSVEVGGPSDLIAGHLEPGCAHTGAVSRAVVTMHRSDLPVVDCDIAAAEQLSGLFSQRCRGLGAPAQGVLGFPGAGGDALTRLAVDQ